MARRNYYRGKYKIDKDLLQLAQGYAHCYKRWLKEYNQLEECIGAIRHNSGRKDGESKSQTEKLALRMAELRSKMETVERAAFEADAELYPWILKAVTTWGVGYEALAMGSNPIPCGKDMYHHRRRKFYWILAKRI